MRYLLELNQLHHLQHLYYARMYYMILRVLNDVIDQIGLAVIGFPLVALNPVAGDQL